MEEPLDACRLIACETENEPSARELLETRKGVRIQVAGVVVRAVVSRYSQDVEHLQVMLATSRGSAENAEQCEQRNPGGRADRGPVPCLVDERLADVEADRADAGLGPSHCACRAGPPEEFPRGRNASRASATRLGLLSVCRCGVPGSSR
jgi:hypothetical protein